MGADPNLRIPHAADQQYKGAICSSYLSNKVFHLSLHVFIPYLGEKAPFRPLADYTPISRAKQTARTLDCSPVEIYQTFGIRFEALVVATTSTRFDMGVYRLRCGEGSSLPDPPSKCRRTTSTWWRGVVACLVGLRLRGASCTLECLSSRLEFTK